jgi:glucose-6-phosphate 1-dehydrogenase
MSEFDCDALVFFGATGDLAYKRIFPSLQAMAKPTHTKQVHGGRKRSRLSRLRVAGATR